MVSAVFSQQSSDFRPSNKAFYAYNYDISPGYLTAAGTSLVAGRDVSFADTAKTPPVAIVNQEFARRLFHSEHAIGRYFKDRNGVSIQIVGIVADGKQFTLAEDPCRAWSAGEADSLGSARSHADPAREWVSGGHFAGRGGQPDTLSHRLPSLRARSIRACCCCIDLAAHRITFGRRTRATRPARRPGNPAPRTIVLLAFLFECTRVTRQSNE